MTPIQMAMSLIHKWEGCVLTAYPDPATGGDPWTIGYGATGPDIQQGMVWTQDQADADLSNRLNSLSVEIDKACTNTMTPNQHAACMSLAYNIGIGAFLASTLLRVWNEGEAEQAADQFLVWNKAEGKVMQGLVNRRADERRVFLGGDPS